MSGAWSRFAILLGLLLLLSTAALRGQKDDLSNDVKNIPKDVGDAMQPTPPQDNAGTSVPQRRTIEPAGTYINQFSGVQFPKRVGEFGRTSMELFDSEGRNVGGAYQKKVGGSIVNVVSVFSYPVVGRLAGSGTAAIFESEKSWITSHQPTARLIREEPYRAPSGVAGDFAEYEINISVGKGKSVPVRSRIYLFADRGWLLKFRTTYPVSRAREGAAETEAFLRGFGTGVVRN